jgi:hypothetical protein
MRAPSRVRVPRRNNRLSFKVLGFVCEVNEALPPDVDPVVVFQKMLVNAFTVHQRSIRTPQIMQKRIGNHGDDLRVIRGHRRKRQANIVIGATSNRDAITVQQNLARAAIRLMNDQFRHDD